MIDKTLQVLKAVSESKDVTCISMEKLLGYNCRGQLRNLYRGGYINVVKTVGSANARNVIIDVNVYELTEKGKLELQGTPVVVKPKVNKVKFEAPKPVIRKKDDVQVCVGYKYEVYVPPTVRVRNDQPMKIRSILA